MVVGPTGGPAPGWLLANWGSAALVAFSAWQTLPRLEEAGIDDQCSRLRSPLRAGQFACRLAPALQASRVELNDALKPGRCRGPWSRRYGPHTQFAGWWPRSRSRGAGLRRPPVCSSRALVALHKPWRWDFAPENVLVMETKRSLRADLEGRAPRH